MKITFIKAPKPRRFVHKNIYYDPEKEEREERELRVNKELGLTDKDEPFKTSIRRGSFRRPENNRGVDLTPDMQRERKMANIRFVIIAVILIVIAGILYFTSGDYLKLM